MAGIKNDDFKSPCGYLRGRRGLEGGSEQVDGGQVMERVANGGLAALALEQAGARVEGFDNGCGRAIVHSFEGRGAGPAAGTSRAPIGASRAMSVLRLLRHSGNVKVLIEFRPDESVM